MRKGVRLMPMCLLLEFHSCYKQVTLTPLMPDTLNGLQGIKTHNGSASCLEGGLPLCVLFVYSFFLF